MAVENSKVLIIVNNWGIEETELTPRCAISRPPASR